MRVSSISRSPRCDGVAGGVELDAGVAQRLLGRAAAAPQQRPQARAELLERERLDQVVVGARVEALDAVGHGVARGQHQHRRAVARGPQAPADLEPVGLGHQHVEDDRVRRRVGERVQRLGAVGRQLHAVAVHPQRAIQSVAHRGLIVHHQDPHGPMVWELTENGVRSAYSHGSSGRRLG